MIAFQIAIYCNGCRLSRQTDGVFYPEYSALPAIALSLVKRAAGQWGWTVDGDAHWCPRCTRQRTAEGNRKLGSTP